jgi:hypothetical protein
MSIRLTPEQLELQSSFRKFLSTEWGQGQRRPHIEARQSTIASCWQRLEDFGAFALFSGEFDVDSPGLRELSVLAHEAGRGLVPEPMVETVFAAGYLLGLVKDELPALRAAFGSEFVDGIVSGEHKVALAMSTFGTPQQVTRRGAASTSRVDCKLSFVTQPHKAALVLFVGQTNDGELRLHLARFGKSKEQRVNATYSNSVDLLRAYQDIELANVATFVFSQQNTLKAQLALMVLFANELAGLATAVVELTAEYTKTRKQFGSPIGGFQAVQHKLADMYARAEATRSLAEFAAWACVHSESQSELVSRAAIMFASNEVPTIVESSIQLHGGIGFTWEYDLHLFLRRAQFLATLSSGTSTSAEALIAACSS